MQLEQCTNFLLTNAQHKVFQMLKKELSVYDVTPIQHGVLKCLLEKDLHNPKDIAEQLSIENSTISGILDRMENKGLITRSIDINDRRHIHVDLTEAGRVIENNVDQVVYDVNERALKSFSNEEIKELKRLLVKIVEN